MNRIRCALAYVRAYLEILYQFGDRHAARRAGEIASYLARRK